MKEDPRRVRASAGLTRGRGELNHRGLVVVLGYVGNDVTSRVAQDVVSTAKDGAVDAISAMGCLEC
jgi:hypothetical protein